MTRLANTRTLDRSPQSSKVIGCICRLAFPPFLPSVICCRRQFCRCGISLAYIHNYIPHSRLFLLTRVGAEVAAASLPLRSLPPKTMRNGRKWASKLTTYASVGGTMLNLAVISKALLLLPLVHCLSYRTRFWRLRRAFAFCCCMLIFREKFARFSLLSVSAMSSSLFWLLLFLLLLLSIFFSTLKCFSMAIKRLACLTTVCTGLLAVSVAVLVVVGLFFLYSAFWLFCGFVFYSVYNTWLSLWVL